MPCALDAELNISPSACPQKMELVPAHKNCSSNLGFSFLSHRSAADTVLGGAVMPKRLSASHPLRFSNHQLLQHAAGIGLRYRSLLFSRSPAFILHVAALSEQVPQQSETCQVGSFLAPSQNIPPAYVACEETLLLLQGEMFPLLGQEICGISPRRAGTSPAQGGGVIPP